MRRNIRTLWATALLVMAMAGMALMPGSAQAAETACIAIYPRPAACDAPQAASLTYRGWTYLNLNYCPPGMFCTQVYRESMTAWRWTGYAWRQTSLRQGWVYVWPYTGSWRWAWTQETGWVAVTGGRFEIRY